jgi:hypothetical protein
MFVFNHGKKKKHLSSILILAKKSIEHENSYITISQIKLLDNMITAIRYSRKPCIWYIPRGTFSNENDFNPIWKSNDKNLIIDQILPW